MDKRKLTFDRLQKLRKLGESLHDLREKRRDKKTERLQLRVTPSEKAEVLIMCDRFGVTVADYLLHLHRRAQAELDRQIERDHEGDDVTELRDALRNADDDEGRKNDEDGGEPDSDLVPQG